MTIGFYYSKLSLRTKWVAGSILSTSQGFVKELFTQYDLSKCRLGSPPKEPAMKSTIEVNKDLKKAFTEIPDLNARINKGENLLTIVKGVEKYADRSRLKPAEKQEMAKITRQWQEFGLNPRIVLTGEQAEMLVATVNAKIEKIKKRRNQLQLLQGWAEQMGDVEAIEFRVYTLVDGMPLDLVRSTGWVDD